MATGGFSPDQFTCSICLDVFSRPVTIPCGHNFCRGCIQTFWTKGEQSCPLCLRAFPQTPELAVNHILEALVTGLKVDQDPKPAKPAAQGDDNMEMCDKHGKALSLFCMEDKTLLCHQCASEDQNIATRNVIVPAVEQIPQIKKMLLNEKLTTMKSARAVKMELFKAKTTVESLKESTELQKATLDADFAELSSALSDVKKRAMSSIEEKERELLQKAERKVVEMEKVHKGLEDEMTQMDLSLKSDDPHKLLQTYNAAQRSSRGATKPSDCVVLKEELVQVLEEELVQVLEEELVQATDIRQQLINEVDKIWKGQAPITAKALDIDYASRDIPWSALEKYKEALTFDPSTAGSCIWVSPDRTEALNTHPLTQPEPRDTDGVKDCEVRATQRFSGGRHFWKVQFARTRGYSEYYGNVGVKNSNAECSLSVEIASDTQGQLVNVYYSGKKVESERTSGWYPTFGVYLDYESGILSIYGADKNKPDQDAKLLYSFNTNFCQYSLFPFFEVKARSRMVLL